MTKKPENNQAETVDNQDLHNEQEAEQVGANAELEALKNELELKKKEAAGLLDQFLRERAENENFRKRMQKEQADFRRFAVEGLLHSLLPIQDDLERAVASAQTNKDFDSLVSGVKLIAEHLKTVLEKAGLTAVPVEGQPFDPAHHEAVRVVENDEHKDNTVIEELRKGYYLNGRILRPAMVTVTKKKN